MDWSQAKAYHRQRDAERRRARERRRQELYQRVKRAIRQLAPQFPAIAAVYLYGSLVREGRFGSRSDVDVAVVADDVEAESRFWRALEEALQRDVDLRPYQGAVAWAVDTYGECIYEREVPAAGTEHSA